MGKKELGATTDALESTGKKAGESDRSSRILTMMILSKLIRRQFLYQKMNNQVLFLEVPMQDQVH
jgi:hypothetical protein